MSESQKKGERNIRLAKNFLFLCKRKANFSRETKTLLIYWLSLCSIAFCHLSDNFVIQKVSFFDEKEFQERFNIPVN